MTNPIGPDLFRHLAAASDPAIAPDGSRCAYALSWIDADTSESRSRIYLAALTDAGDGETAEPRPFTRGNSDTHPRFAPDGATLAFLRADDAAPARRQVWLMPLDGGEAGQLTHLPNGAREFAWAPDSARLAVVADVCPDDVCPDDGDVDSGFRRNDDNTGRNDGGAIGNGGGICGDGGGSGGDMDSGFRRNDGGVFGNDGSKGNGGGSVGEEPRVREVRRIRYRHDAIGWRGDCHFHLFVVDVKTGETAQITSGDWDDTAPAWSPDGGRIAFISGRSESRDVTASNEVYVVDVSEAGESASASEPELWSEGLTDAAAVAWSPDGRRLLAVGGTGEGLMTLWLAYLYVLEPGQPPRRVTDDAIRPCIGYPGIYPSLELRWTNAPDAGNDNDGRIIFLADAAGATRLYALDLPAGDGIGSLTPLTDGGELLSGIAMDAAARRVALVASNPASPSDLHCVATDGGRQRLTGHNDAWLAEHPPAPMEKFIIERDDFDVECRLYHPPGFDASQKYPLVLEIHGGPNAAFYDSFVPWHQTLAGAGYLTLAVNPRGSSTYGAEFVNAVLGDWGGDDFRDLMAALDVVCQREYVDAERLGVHGYSYGGYMTTWAIGHTQRFRAAVAGAPCIDLWSMYGTSDIATSFGETHWANRLAGGMSISRPLVDELAQAVDSLAYRLLQRSPITFAPQVETPVLLLHGESDARCPIGQSEQYFQVMKRLGKEVEMARFPGCSHGFLRTGHVALRQAYLQRMLDWFQRWL